MRPFLIALPLLLAAEAGAQSPDRLAYLRNVSLTASVDTFDTWTSPRGGRATTKGNDAYLVKTFERVGSDRWQFTNAWKDSTHKVTALQRVLTARNSLAIQYQTVRADVDSATLYITPERVIGWVVPQNTPPRLIDGPFNGDRFADDMVVVATRCSAAARAFPCW